MSGITEVDSGTYYLVTVELTDKTGAPITPISITWFLTDSVGAVINGRTDQTITAASSFWVLLQGADLPAGIPGSVQLLKLTFTVVFNDPSPSYGENITKKFEQLLNVRTLVGAP